MAKKLTQEDVNEFYRKAYVSVTEAALLTGSTRQNVWYLVSSGKLDVHRDEVGNAFVSTIQLRGYTIQRRKELLKQLAKLKLPTE